MGGCGMDDGARRDSYLLFFYHSYSLLLSAKWVFIIGVLLSTPPFFDDPRKKQKAKGLFSQELRNSQKR